MGTNKSKWVKYKPLLWMIAIPALNIIYGILNEHSSEVRMLITPLDRQIPFLPAFIIPYIVWYPFIALTLLFIFLKDVRVYFKTLLALCLGLLVSYVFYYYFQTTVPRPKVGEGGILNYLVQFIYAHDLPYNCFPSIHVLTSYLMMKGARVLKRWGRLTVQFIGIMIIASTLFVKQHVLADVGMAIIVAECTFLLAKLILPYLMKLKLRVVAIATHEAG
ncbi:hypothetical protein E0485_10260 [Paenibacillus albiflavus]|uniref:Phosphatidic acid phosphatase type 2/haloperoxidase domain-containing protein n=1 Tax=Paenibacillus albiflavus TaxID=2545760 RepID=A0A4R4EFJ9_9BACL|nr:hypothetical protein E0485_10260 [Paenibacillus albiflavus]